MRDLVDTTEMYLRTVYELEEEGITPLRARIAERLEQSGPTVSQTVARMERDGLVQRTPMPGDGRSQLVSLTKAARAKLPAARKALHRNQNQALAGFSTVEAATLLDLLRRLNRNLDRMVAEEVESGEAVDA